MRWLTGRRGDLSGYGFVPLGLLAWCIPDTLIGITGAADVEGILLVAGFPIFAAYLGGLLTAEWIERRKQEKLKVGG